MKLRQALLALDVLEYAMNHIGYFIDRLGKYDCNQIVGPILLMG